MNARLLCLISFITGAIISVMVTFNTELGTLTTNEVSITINQIVGIEEPTSFATTSQHLAICSIESG